MRLAPCRSGRSPCAPARSRYGRLARAADLDGVLLRLPVRGRFVGRVGNGRERRVPLRLGGGQLVLGGLQLRLDRPQLLELLGGGLAGELRPGAESSTLGTRLASARRRRAGRRAPPLRPPRERRAERVGVGAGLEVDHGWQSRRAGEPLARGARDVRRDVLDVLLAQRAGEGGHRPERSSPGRRRGRSSAEYRRGWGPRCRTCRRRRAYGTCRSPKRRGRRPCRRPDRPRSARSRRGRSPSSRCRSCRLGVGRRWSSSRSSRPVVRCPASRRLFLAAADRAARSRRRLRA